LSQIVLPQRLQFNVGPMSFDTLMTKLYPPVFGPYRYRRSAGVRGIGDAASDFLAYEAQLSQAWSQGPQAISTFETNPSNVPASLQPTPSVPIPASGCSPTSCPAGPYPGNDSANYDYWLNQTTTPDQQKAGQQTQTISQQAMQAAATGQPVALMSYNDLLAQAGLQTCDPRDSTCVANNEAREAAVEQYWVNSGEHVPAGTVLAFASLTPAQVAQFYSPITGQGGNVVDTTGVLTVSQTGSGTYTPSTNVKPNQSTPPTSQLTPKSTGIQKTGQVLQTIYGSGATQSGTGQTDSSGSTSTSGSGSTLLIVAAVGVGLFFLMERKS
jgi:hypothetical protein